MLQLRMSGATSPLPIFLCGLYMDDLACASASAFIRHAENSLCPGYWLPFACSLPHYILPVPTLCPDVPQLPYFFHAEAGGSRLPKSWYLCAKLHISEDNNINNQWADTQMVSAYFLFCSVIRYTFLIAYRAHKNCNNWSFHNRLVQNYIICMIKMKVNLPLCRP